MAQYDLALLTWLNEKKSAISGSIGRDHPVNTGLSLSATAAGSKISATDINNLVSNLQTLKSNTFLSYADYPTFPTITQGALIKYPDYIDTAINNLKNICGNQTSRTVNNGNSKTTGFNDVAQFSTSSFSTSSNSTRSGNGFGYSTGNGRSTGNGVSTNGTWQCRSVNNGQNGFWTCGNYQSTDFSTSSNSTSSTGNSTFSGYGVSSGNGVSTGYGNRYFSPDFAYDSNTPLTVTYTDFSVKYVNGAYQVTQNSNT